MLETTIYPEYETAASTDINGFENVTYTDFRISIHVNALSIFQMILLTIGAIGNILILVVLRESKDHLQPVTLTLVKHQSVTDACVCVTLIVQTIIPRFWTSGYYYLDVVLCHLMHSYGLYILSLTSLF